MAVVILHQIKGRLRLGLGPAGRGAKLCPRAEALLSGMEGVIWTRANPALGCVVVGFDPRLVQAATLLKALGEGLREPAGTQSPGRLPARRKERRRTRRPPLREGGETSRQRLRFLTLAGVVTASVFRSRVLGLATAQTLFSPLGLVTVVFAWPLLRRGLAQLGQGRFSLEAMLGGASLAAAAGGEALTALEILGIDAGANWLMAWVGERSRRAISQILDLTSHHTFMILDGVETEVEVASLRPGDVVVLHSGEKVPVDGEVVKGEALVDESPINGRSQPALCGPGRMLHAGTLVQQGVIQVRARRVGDDTYLARVMHMVEQSLEHRAPVEGVAQALAARTARLGVGAAALVLLVTQSFQRAFSVLLVMACPCATTLAAASAISAAISNAASKKVLIKGGRHLEEVGQARALCFDKTGTLTTTTPEIRAIVNYSGLSEDQLLELAYSTELHQHHPIAQAIQEEAKRRGARLVGHEVCDYRLGRGLMARIEGLTVLLGNRKLMDEWGVDLSPAAQDHAELAGRGLTTVFLAREGSLLALFGLANQVRPQSGWVLGQLRAAGVTRVALVTGDEECTALDLAAELGMDACRHGVLPEEKADYIRRLRRLHGKVIMVGDGINDALALAEADVGIAMGAGGSEMAVEAADIALVNDDLRGVVFVRRLSQQTMRVIKQNFWIASASNLAGLALGALGMLPPVAAGLLHLGHTAAVLANSTRLLGFDLPPDSPPRPAGLPTATAARPDQRRAA